MDNLDLASLCAIMLRDYHIPPSVTMMQPKALLEDVLTLIRVWKMEHDLQASIEDAMREANNG